MEPNPLRVFVSRHGGALLQELNIDQSTGAMSFALGNSPLLGLGEGGRQFDRMGGLYTMKTGSHSNMNGEEKLTIGGRVPVPLLVSTGGWAMLVNFPWGQFDLTGEKGLFTPNDSPDAQALDVFVIDAHSPPYATMAKPSTT